MSCISMKKGELLLSFFNEMKEFGLAPELVLTSDTHLFHLIKVSDDEQEEVLSLFVKDGKIVIGEGEQEIWYLPAEKINHRTPCHMAEAVLSLFL